MNKVTQMPLNSCGSDKSDSGCKCRGGITYLEAAQLTLVVLKLCNVIDWSWWVVFLPTILPIAFALICMVILAVAEIIEGA